MGEIDIGTVLNKLNQPSEEGSLEVKSFGIKFITADGRIREMHCRKNVRAPKAGKNFTDPKGKLAHNLKYNGVILMHDIEAAAPRDVKVAMIGKFRDYQSNVWLSVRH